MPIWLSASLRVVALTGAGFIAGSTVVAFARYRHMLVTRGAAVPLKLKLFVPGFLVLLTSEFLEQMKRLVESAPVTMHLPFLLLAIPMLATSVHMYLMDAERMERTGDRRVSNRRK